MPDRHPSSVAGSSAMPVPLSPDQFGDPGQPSATAPRAGTMLTSADRLTLQAALQMLKRARTDAGDVNRKVAAARKEHLTAVVSYLAGFFDSRGWLVAAPVSPGLEALFGARAQPSLDEAISELEISLESVLAEVDTRGILHWIGVAVSAVGDACIAVGAAIVVVPTPV